MVKIKIKAKLPKKKPVAIFDVVDEEEKTNSKENQEQKDLRNSEAFNKNESLGINIMNHINDEDELRNIENNIILENENEKNLTEDKQDDNLIRVKKDSLNNQNDLINSPLQNELIKEKISSEFINNNLINANPDLRLKNKKVEASSYISEKK